MGLSTRQYSLCCPSYFRPSIDRDDLRVVDGVDNCVPAIMIYSFQMRYLCAILFSIA